MFSLGNKNDVRFKISMCYALAVNESETLQDLVYVILHLGSSNYLNGGLHDIFLLVAMRLDHSF